jgi:hypothetical protein
MFNFCYVALKFSGVLIDTKDHFSFIRNLRENLLVHYKFETPNTHLFS